MTNRAMHCVSAEVLWPGHIRPQSMLCLSLDVRGREHHARVPGSDGEGSQSPGNLCLKLIPSEDHHSS